MSDQVEISAFPSGQDAQVTAQLGLLLRKAREARGLTVADVVAALKYSPRQIEALEADQMALLPSSVFLRGIVRSYARFLKLDPVPLIALLDAGSPTVAPDVRPPEDMGIAMPRVTRQIPTSVAVVVLVAALVAAGGVWHFLAPLPPPPESTTAANAQTVVDGAPLPPPGTVVVEAGTAATDISPPGVIVAPSTTAQLPAASSPAVPQAVPVTAEGKSAAVVRSAPIIPGGKEIVFGFRGMSWVEVRDATQRVVLTGQYSAGNRETATGRPPFQIVIGNAPQVEVKFDGRNVDLAPYSRADVARFTLE